MEDEVVGAAVLEQGPVVVPRLVGRENPEGFDKLVLSTSPPTI